MYTESIKKSRETLASGRKLIAMNALRNATAPKRVYKVEELTDMDYYLVVSYTDQDDNEYDEKRILKAALIEFVGEHYRDTVDTFFDGAHYQYVDGRSNTEYFEENRKDVVKDFLNAKGQTNG